MANLEKVRYNMCLVCRDGHSLTFLNINFMTQYFSKFQNNNQQFRGAQTRVWYKTTCDLHASFCSVYCKWLNCSNLNTYLRSFPEPPFLDDVPTPLQGFWHLCQKRNGAFKRVRILFRQRRNNRRGNHFCSEGFYKHRQQQRRVDLEIFWKILPESGNFPLCMSLIADVISVFERSHSNLVPKSTSTEGLFI